jgi:hypothetical protein
MKTIIFKNKSNNTYFNTSIINIVKNQYILHLKNITNKVNVSRIVSGSPVFKNINKYINNLNILQSYLKY